MQNINWEWGSAGFLRNLTRKDQRIWKKPTARKSEIIIRNIWNPKNIRATQKQRHVMWQDFIMVNRLKCMHLIPWRYWRQVASAHGFSPKGPCDAISEPKIKSRNRTTTMSNVNVAPLEKRTKVELLPAESVFWIWAQVDQFCDAKIETRKSVNPHNNNNLRWLKFRAEWEIDQTFWFLPAHKTIRSGNSSWAISSGQHRLNQDLIVT